ncbi:hypothetical protein QAD02_019660 [Eretmocerus hayati]|uniref:Uncharacterized protein n=1 Tax=Eretmocerus hayati TaxID=131215 RepID=A0ACC2PLB3_9HYME|nr:hypothetical protein QAD02_019660 [Eretmocerus hayati]
MENCAYEDEANKSAHEDVILCSEQNQQHSRSAHDDQGSQQVDPNTLPNAPIVFFSHETEHQSQEHRHHDVNSRQRQQQQQFCSEGHVYEDILYNFRRVETTPEIGCFKRNLTLPLRRECNIPSRGLRSSVNINREQKQKMSNNRASSLKADQPVCTELDDINSLKNWESGRDESLCSGSVSSSERPNRRRRKRDCKHCRNKTASTATIISPKPTQDNYQIQECQLYGQMEPQLDQLHNQSSQLDLEPYKLDKQYVPFANDHNAPPLVYAIGCNAADCTADLANGVDCGNTVEDTDTISLHVAHLQQQQHQQQIPQTSVERSVIGSTKKGRIRAAGMKVNSIYAPEHWQHNEMKETSCSLIFDDHTIQDCDSSFQRTYGSSSTASPSCDNPASLGYSERDIGLTGPLQKPKLSFHRHGWGFYLKYPFPHTMCTKSTILLLIVVLTLLGVGGVAIYIVFEPEKLQVIQQYLRSDTGGFNNSGEVDGEETTENEINFGSSRHTQELMSSTVRYLLTPLLEFRDERESSSSINSNIVPSFNVNEPPKFHDTRPSSEPPISPITSTTFAGRSGNISTVSTNTTPNTTASINITTSLPWVPSVTYSSNSSSKIVDSKNRRPCSMCDPDEVCVAKTADESPYCQIPMVWSDKSECGGLCDLSTQTCHKIDKLSYRCVEMEQVCLDDEWTCLNVFCIPLVKRCDGQMNCYDHSDEFNCECNLETHFHCGNQTSCLPLAMKCDGAVDCYDASDEENCSNKCESTNERMCSNKQQCYLRRRFCDGYKDCNDGSDEPNGCQLGKCNEHEFTCRNGRCIDKTLKCNSNDECGDRSDEQHCKL